MKRVLLIAGCIAWVLGAGMTAHAQDATTEFDEAEILEFLESRVPEAHEMLMAEQADDPSAYQRHVRELGAQIAYYYQIREQSPEFADSLLRAQFVLMKSRSLSTQARAMQPGPERDAVEEQLKGLLEEQFDLELLKPEMEIEFLEKEVVRLRQRIERQREARDNIVGLRLRAALGEEPEPDR